MRRGLIHYAGNLAPILSGLLTAPLTARALGVEDRGQLAIILMGFTAVSAVGTLGFGWLARDAIGTDKYSATFWRSRSGKISLAFIPFSFCLGAILTNFLDLSQAEKIITLLFYLLASGTAIRSVDANVLISMGKVKELGYINLIFTLTVTAGIVISFLLDTLSISTAVVCNICGGIVQILFLGRNCSRVIAVEQRLYLERKTAMGVDPKYSWKQTLTRGMESWRAQILDMSVTRVDMAIAGLSRSHLVTGYYSVIQILPQLGYNTFLTLVQFSFSKHPSLDSKNRLRLLLHTCTMISILLCLIAAPIAYWGIPIVFGADFTPARSMLISGIFVTLGLGGAAAVFQDAARIPNLGMTLFLLVATPTLAGVVGILLFDAVFAISIFGFVLLICCYAYGYKRVERSIFHLSVKEILLFFVLDDRKGK